MTDDVDLLMMGAVNPEVSHELREECRQRLQNSLLQQQQANVSNEKIQEAANKIEESVFVATLTREDYERMISARINFICNSTSSNSNSSNAGSRRSSNNSDTSSNPPLKSLTDEEKQYVIGKLAPLQVHLPKMEKLLSLFSQQQIPNSGRDPELMENIRKYAALKGVLHKQLELFPQGAYIVTPTSANSLVEHVHKLTSFLVYRAKSLAASNNSNNTLATLPSKPTVAAASSKKIISIAFELPNFNRTFIDEQALRKELELLNPKPEVIKLLQERPDRFVVYLGSGGFLVRFFLKAGHQVEYQIERGRNLLTPCTHGVIGGPANIRSVWRHLMHHHYAYHQRNKM